MDDFDRMLEKNLKNPEFKKHWDKLQFRSKVIDILVDIRQKHDLTQKELAKRLKTTQAVISRIENGNVNIGWDFINRLAKAFDKDIEIRLIDKKQKKIA